MEDDFKHVPGMQDIDTRSLEDRLGELETQRTSENKSHATSTLDIVFKLVVVVGVVGIFTFLAILDHKTDRNHVVELRNRAVICEEVSEELDPGSECYRPNVRVLWDNEYAETHSGD